MTLGQRAYEAWVAAKKAAEPSFYAQPWARLRDRDAWEAIGLACAQAALEALCGRIQSEALASLSRPS